MLAEAFRWTADERGEWLCILCERPRAILETIKAGKRYNVDIKEYRKKRSLDANALYWALLTALAKELDISNPRAHNLMLRRYGAPWRVDEQMVFTVIPDTDEAENTALEAETVHMRPTAQVREGKDGKTYRTYVLLRGSSDYDTAEMGRLIDGLISECKEMGIDTMSARERGLIEDWEARNGY